MRRHAFINNNIVVKIEELDDAGYQEQAMNFQLIVDIEDLIVVPEAGWVFNGVNIVPNSTQINNIRQMVTLKIAGYQEIAPKLLRELYVDNTLLGITTQQSDAMFDMYADVVLRISQGAFPTAVHRLQQKKPSGFVTQFMINNWISRVQKYL